jgi:hypothetical protein
VTVGGVTGKRFVYKPVGDTTETWDITLVEKDGKAYEFWTSEANDGQGLEVASSALTSMTFTDTMPSPEVTEAPGSISPAVTP